MSTRMGLKKTLWAASVAAASIGAAVQPAMAGPTWQFGEQGSVTATYAVQAWYRNIDYSAPVNDDSDFYLRRLNALPDVANARY